MILQHFHVTPAYQQSHIFHAYVYIYIYHIVIIYDMLITNVITKTMSRNPSAELWTMACTDSLTSYLILAFTAFEIMIFFLIPNIQKMKVPTHILVKKMGHEDPFTFQLSNMPMENGQLTAVIVLLNPPSTRDFPSPTRGPLVKMVKSRLHDAEDRPVIRRSMAGWQG